MAPVDSAKGVVVLNPVSGSGQHAEAIRRRATLLGYSIRETEEAGDAITFAREAAEDGVPVVAAAGGDGTLNEVVRGIDEADAFGRVTLAVIPTGTGNNFAQNVGITTLEEGFAVMEGGERRRIDLGQANGHPFVNSCVGGLTADASGETTSDMKNRFGVLAYVITTLQTVTAFEGLRMKVDARNEREGPSMWTGRAVCVLIGNGRRFTAQGSTQANMEDGLFDVAIVEDVSTLDLVGDTVVERLLGEESAHITRLQASTLDVGGQDPEPINFSLDGEMVQYQTLSLAVRPKTLQVFVGDAYRPDPDTA